MAFIRSRFSAIILACACTTAAGTNEEGKKFLEANKVKEGVITLPSGLQYKVLKKGSGKKHPKVDDPCSCHYKGTLIDGTQFDSSYDRGEPTTFAPNQVIRGWTEAMQLMVEGDKWEMYIPSELGYGEGGSPPKIPGGSVLIFTMEIMKINGEGVPAVTCDPETLEDCDDKEKKYVEKMKAKEAKDVTAEHERLDKMWKENSHTKNLTKKVRVWLEARLKILEKMTQPSKKEEL